MEKKCVALTDIDLVTFLKSNGYEGKAVVEDDRVVFYFDDHTGEIEAKLQEYPTSTVNNILSVYHGLYKLVRSMVRNK